MPCLQLAKKEKREATITTGTSEVESEALAESGVDEDPAPATKPHVEFSPPIVVDVPDTPPNVKVGLCCFFANYPWKHGHYQEAILEPKSRVIHV